VVTQTSNEDISWTLLNILDILGANERERCIFSLIPSHSGLLKLSMLLLHGILESCGHLIVKNSDIHKYEKLDSKNYTACILDPNSLLFFASASLIIGP